jgi:hypothetical protein
MSPQEAGTATTTVDGGLVSTTTLALDGRGGGAGAKLTALSPSDAGPPTKHQAELGRGVADIQAIVAAHRDEARTCYDKGLVDHPWIEGTLDVRWTIDPSGKVVDAEVDTAHSEILEPYVGGCIVGIVKNLHFNTSAKGFETKAHYPFNFHPHSHRVVTTDAGH